MSKGISTKDHELVNLLNAHPSLKERVEQRLQVVEDKCTQSLGQL